MTKCGKAIVQKPLYEKYAVNAAIYQMIMENRAVLQRYRKFMPEASYDDRWAEFKKRFTITSTKPRLSVDENGWYRVESIEFWIFYEDNEGREYVHYD